MKRLTLLPLAAAVSFAQANPVAAPAVAAPEAPLAPVATTLLNGNAAAPVSIDDVLLVPHASAGQKAVAFEWADSGSQAFVLWNKVFAAAQYTGGAGAQDAKTLASFGYMTPGYGVGLKFSYRTTRTESTDNVVVDTRRNYSSASLFGSYLLGDKDLYASVNWQQAPGETVYEDNPVDPSMPKYTQKYDATYLNVGLRKGPAAGQEGLGWNVALTPGTVYSRPAGGDGGYAWILNVDGQVGYAFLTDGITFLPGLDAFWHHENAKADDDYANDFGLRPSAAIIIPVFEHWTVHGGVNYTWHATVNDETVGKPSTFNDVHEVAGTSGGFGVRYARDRWAVEAQVSNGFLASGPYFISGQSSSDNFLARLGFTVNLK